MSENDNDSNALVPRQVNLPVVLDDFAHRGIQIIRRNEDIDWSADETPQQVSQQKDAEFQRFQLAAAERRSRRALPSDLHPLDPNFAWVTVSDSGTITDCNNLFASLVGTDASDVIDKSVAVFLRQQDFLASLDYVREHGKLSNLEEEIQRTDGTSAWTLQLWRPYAFFRNEHDEEPLYRGVHVQMVDISDIKRDEEAADHAYYYDEITSLPNRKLLQDHFYGMARHVLRLGTGSVVALAVDLDRFDAMTFAAGTQVTGAVLGSVGRAIRSTLDLFDIVARIGADKFVVLAHDDAAAGNASRVASQILDQIRQTAPVSASIGIACFPHDGDDLATLLRKAGSAVYASKANGGDQWAFYAPR